MIMTPANLQFALRLLLRCAVLTLLCLILLWLLNSAPAISAFDQRWIDSQTRHHGVYGMLNYLWVATLLLSIGLPRQLAAFLAGYAFGFATGLLLSMLAVTLSCVLVLLVSRVLARPLLQYFFQLRVAQLSHFLQQQPFAKALLLRLFPVGNNLLTNLAAGVGAVPVVPFVLGSMLGYLPQMLIFALMGKGILLQSGWKIALSLALFALSSVLSWYLYQQYRRNKLSASLAADSEYGDAK